MPQRGRIGQPLSRRAGQSETQATPHYASIPFPPRPSRTITTLGPLRQTLRPLSCTLLRLHLLPHGLLLLRTRRALGLPRLNLPGPCLTSLCLRFGPPRHLPTLGLNPMLCLTLGLLLSLTLFPRSAPARSLRPRLIRPPGAADLRLCAFGPDSFGLYPVGLRLLPRHTLLCRARLCLSLIHI